MPPPAPAAARRPRPSARALFPFIQISRRKGPLPVDIPQPQRHLGILRLAGPARNPAATAFAGFVVQSFASLQQLILRHENAVIWRR
jgi:hypothetical protein